MRQFRHGLHHHLARSLALLGGLLLTSCASATANHPSDSVADCPLEDLGETALDCPWASIARQLIASPAPTGRELIPDLDRLWPRIREDAQLDRQSSALRALWGKSLNFDENTKREIIDPRILEALSLKVGVKAPNNRTAHAGVQHTYGYLMSVEKTPFGYKRARWVQDTIEKGFGLSRGTLGPTPAQGSLLSNVTYFAAKLALSQDPQAKKALETSRHLVPRELSHYDWTKLSGTRLIETLTVGKSVIELRTDFVAFPEGAQGQNSHLLIYSVSERPTRSPSSPPTEKIITLFPVSPSFLDQAISQKGLGLKQPVQTRYNAFVEGITDQPKKSGSRRVLSREPL